MEADAASVGPVLTPHAASTGAEQIAAFFARSREASQQPLVQRQVQEYEPMPDPGPLVDQALHIFNGSVALGGVRTCSEALTYARRCVLPLCGRPQMLGRMT